MAANFEVKFIVDRVSGNYKIRITDTSTGFTLAKANTKITFPDGYVVENTDVSNPDISSAGGYVEKAIRFNVANKPITGDYKINFTGFDASDNEYTSQKQFNFTWQEPSIVIQDLSDTGVPIVKFKDITGWDQGNFTEVASTRQFEVDYPQTSALTGQSKTESQTNLGTALEIDMANSDLYYEGVYSTTLSIDITYSHTNGYLSVQYKKNSTQDFPIKRTPSQTELLNKINQYKQNIDEYKTTSPDVYAKYAEEYDNVLALYSHAVSRYKLGIGDGAQDSVEELLDLIEDQTVHTYLSTPLSSFSIDENDFGANALITKLKSEIGTFDSDGNLQTIAKAFADEIFEVEATDFKAEASKLSTLLAQFGTYDANTNTFTFLGTASYFEQVKSYADNDKASATALSNLFSQFGTYDANTDTFTFSSTANYFEEVKTYADNDKASAQALTTLTSQFGSYDPNTNTFTFDNTADYFEQVKTYADENSAAASKVSSIGSAFGSFDGNTFNFSEAKITQELNTYTGLDFSNSTYFIDIEAEIASKPIVFRQASEPATTYATGSLWYDTDNDNKVYILDGDPKTWTLTDDSRIGATATQLTTLTAAFGSYDPQTGLTIDTTADYFAEVKSYADTQSAAATKIENLGAELVTFDANGNVTGVVLSSSFKSAIDTFVSDEANSALASKVEGLRVDIEGQDGTGGITAQVTENQQVVAARPKIFRQDDAPATTEPVSSLWFDTNDNNKAYVLLGDGGDPEVFTWTETRDQGLLSDIQGKPFIFRQDDAPATTNPEGSLWYDTNDGNKLYVLVAEVWTTTQDADIATAQATADGRPKVFRQDDAPATTEPEFSIWYDTNDNNLSYVLLGDGGDPETFTWTETIDGRVTDLLAFAEAKYSLNVDANGVVTGLELYSASGPNTTTSTFKITADKFIVRESSTDFVPFTLDGTQLKLDVPLNGVSGSFSGSLTAATGTFSGNVDGNIDGTAAGTVKAGAADGATAKGVTDDLSSVVTITSTDIAIVNTDETKAFYDAGTPFYVDNNGDFSLGDKLKYDNSENLLTISGAVTIESVSGLTKSDVGLGNVDNDSTATILAGNLTGTVNDVAVSTVTDGAAAGTTAKGVTDNLTSVVAITSSDIAIVLADETKTFNDDGTPFYVDNTGQFSLGDKLSYDPTTNTLSITGAVTIESVSGLTKSDVGLGNVDNNSTATILAGDLTGSIDGTAVATVKSGAADGASAKAETDKLTSVVTLTNSDIAIVNTDETKTFYDAGTPFYVDNAGDFSLGNKLKYDNSENLLTISGAVTIESVSGLTKSDVGLGNVDNTSVANILDGTEGEFTGDVTGTIDGAAATTVKTGAADGATAKGETDKLTSVVSLTNSDIAIVNSGTKGYNTAGTPFYVDNTGKFSLGDKLTFSGSTLAVNGEITSTSGNIGGWIINSTELKSPAVNSVNRLELSPTAGFIVNDDDNNTALLVNYGALSSLSSTTTGVTFADVSNAEVATWDETVQAGNTLIKIPASNERHIYSSNYLTASFVNDPHGGAYAYEISIDSITGAIATLTGTSTYLKATLALHVEIATDTNFSNVIKDTELWRSDVTGATTITFPGVSNKAISFSISDSVTDVYLRFYWYRMYAVAYNDSITWSPKTFNVSSADANDDLVFLTYKGTTELTNEGVQIINDPTTYFKVDRSNFTSGNPYVDIGGDVKVDGNFTVTGNINLEGDVENSDVTVSNLVERLGEINTAFTLGSSASADVTFAGDVQVDGTLKGPASFTIDPSAYGDATGTVVILGNLQVDGTTTTINSTNVTIDDKILTLSSGAADSTAANDSGIEIDGASAYFKYFHTGTKWVSNKSIEAGTFIGALSGNASSASTAAQLTTARTISLTGTITGSASFDGTADISIATSTSFDLDDVTTNGATTTNDISTGRITLANNVSTGGFTSFDDYQLLLYKNGTSVSESYGIGIEGNTMMFNSDTNYRFYVDNDLKVNINGDGYVGIGTDQQVRQLVISNAGGNGIELDANQSGLSEIISYDRTLNAYTPLIFNALRYQFDTGSVGIGTNDPNSKLHVVTGGTSGYAGADRGILVSDNNGARLILEHTTATTGARNYVLRSESGIFSLALLNDAGTSWTADNILNANSAGEIGIGTVSPQATLDVQGDVMIGDYLKINSSSSYMGVIGFNRDIDNGNIYNSSYGAYQIHNYQGEFQVQVYNSAGTQQTIHRFHNDGDVSIMGQLGVATTSPASPLHVEGNSGTNGQVVNIYNTSSNSDTKNTVNIGDDRINTWGLIIGKSGINTADTGSYHSPDGAHIVNVQNGDLRFGTNNTTRLTIDKSGEVGIGTTSPSQKLHIEGSVKIGSGLLYMDAQQAINFGAAAQIYYNSTTGGIQFTGTSGGNTLFVKNNGDVGINGSTVSYSNYRYLTINGNSATEGGVLYLRTSDASRTAEIFVNSNGFYISGNNAGQKMFFNTAGSSKMALDANGYLGIGYLSPSDRLAVNGDISFGNGYNGGVYADRNGTGDSDANWGFQIQRTSGVDDYNVRLKFFPEASSSRKLGLYNSRADNWILYADGNTSGNPNVIIPEGKLGIGTTSPNQKLQVEGSIRLNDELQIYTGTTDIGQISNLSGALNIQGTSTRDVSLGSDTKPQSVFLEGTNGYLGIGTTTPNRQLEVKNSGDAWFRLDGAGAYFDFLMDGNLRMFNANGEAMRITSAGNVGLSSTVSGWSLGRTLEIGSNYSNISFSGTSAIFGIVNTYYNGSAYIRQNAGTCASFEYNISVSNAFAWRADGSGSGGASVTLPVKMVLTNGGYLGIGNTNPVRQLVVSNGGGNGIELDANQGGVSEIISYNRSTNAYTPLYTLGTELRYYGSEQNFYINNNLIVRLRSNGTMGIGTTGSDAKLEVVHNGDNGSGGDSQYAILAHASSGQATIGAIHTTGGYANLNLGSSGSGSGLEFWHISYRQATEKKLQYYWYSGGSFTSRFEFETNGDFKAGGDVIAYKSSDERLKDNIKPIENAIDKVKAIGGYEFDWNDNQESYEGHDVGVIAQEIEEVLPEVVTTRDTGYKAVQYEKLVPLLIEAIKEQQKQIDELKAKLNGSTN